MTPQESLINRCRWDRTREELRAFKQDLNRWLVRRREQDTAQQYWSQLRALEACLQSAGAVLEEQIGRLNLSLPDGDLYQQCLRRELQVLWLRRLWRFFRERFDQRDDDVMGPVLRAADEVVWSTWYPVMSRARLLGIPIQPLPVPLPYIEMECSAGAMPADWVPEPLRRDAGSLCSHLQKLPLSVIHLPVACLHAPWWLVFIGHEVGHHVQFGLGLVDSFSQLLEKTVRSPAAGGGTLFSAKDAESWKDWALEVFADIFSIVAMGSSALWAIAEFVRKPPASMCTPLNRYPPAAVRLELMVQAAERLGLHGARQALRGMKPNEIVKGHGPAERALSAVPAIVSAALGPLPLPGVTCTLQELIGFRLDHFQSDWPALPEPVDLSTSRRMASSALEKWTQTEQIQSDDQRAEQRAALAREAISLLEKKYVAGLRNAGMEPPPSAIELGRELGELLAGLGTDELELGRGTP